MIRLQPFGAGIEEAHRKCLQKKILAKLDKINVDKYTKSVSKRKSFQEYLQFIIECVKERDCLVADAQKLGAIVDEVENRFFKRKRIGARTVLGRINKAISIAFGYEAFRDKKGRRNDDWGGEVLMRRLLKNVRYCPYCNAETVYAVEMETGEKRRAPLIKSAFDHYYPKGRYPFLSVSLYNLIPSCYRCNSQFKTAHYEKLRMCYHPYVDSVDESAKFILRRIPVSVWFNEDADVAVEIFLSSKNNTTKKQQKQLANYNDLFQVNRVYSQLYSRDAMDVLHKARVVSDSYLDEIRHWFKDAGLLGIEPTSLIFGTPMDRSRINEFRLSKMIQDLCNTYMGRP